MTATSWDDIDRMDPERAKFETALRTTYSSALVNGPFSVILGSDEGIRSTVSLVAAGSMRSSADVVRAIALGADAVYSASAALIALGCHQCGDCSSGKCNWGIATQRPELTKRLNPEIAAERVVNLIRGWNHEIQEMMGGMGTNAIDGLRGNRLMLRGVGLNEKELEILGVKYAGE